MNAHAESARRGGWALVVVLVALVLWTTATASGRSARHRLFASLRIARPEAVNVQMPAFSGPTGSRRLQDAIAGMLADDVHVTRETSDITVADSVAAARAAAFAPALLGGRSDRPAITVQTGRRMTMTVNRALLETILNEAGRANAAVPASVNGGTLTIDTPAAVIARYGHCPELEGQTLTNQIAQRPPAEPASADCVILAQRPVVAAQAPPGLDMGLLSEIALEVAGMTPVQAADFQRAVPWNAALALTMPRFIRSYDTVTVSGAPGMLINTGARRGPSYELFWTGGGRVYTLTGYGNSADAVSLARSVGSRP